MRPGERYPWKKRRTMSPPDKPSLSQSDPSSGRYGSDFNFLHDRRLLTLRHAHQNDKTGLQAADVDIIFPGNRADSDGSRHRCASGELVHQRSPGRTRCPEMVHSATVAAAGQDYRIEKDEAITDVLDDIQKRNAEKPGT